MYRKCGAKIKWSNKLLLPDQDLCPTLGLHLDPLADQVAQLEHPLVAQDVEGEQAFFPPTDESGCVQDTEVLRDVRLRKPCLLNEFGDAPLPSPQRIEQTQSTGIGQDLEAMRYELEELG